MAEATTQSSILPLPRAPSRHPKPERHVSFKEPPSPPKTHPKPKKDEPRRGCFWVCCTWALLVAVTLILALILVGALFVAFLQSSMPEFRVKTLSVTKFNVTVSPKGSFLNADISLFLQSTNNNDRVGLSYGPMTLDLSTESIKIGQAQVPGFSQRPNDTTSFQVKTEVARYAMYNEDGVLLKTEYKNYEMVFDVVVSGRISLLLWGHKMKGLPFTVVCNSVEPSKVSYGDEPKCKVKMFLN